MAHSETSEKLFGLIPFELSILCFKNGQYSCWFVKGKIDISSKKVL